MEHPARYSVLFPASASGEHVPDVGPAGTGARGLWRDSFGLLIDSIADCSAAAALEHHPLIDATASGGHART